MISYEARVAMLAAVTHTVAGVKLSMDRRYADALPEFGAALRACPTYGEAWYCRGLALQTLGDPKGAYDSFAQAVMLTPGYHEAHDALDQLGPQLGMTSNILTPWPREVKPAWRTCAVRRLRNILGLRDRVVFDGRDEQTLRAELLRAPRSPDIAAALGALLLSQFRVTEAERFFSYTLSLAPWHGEATAGLYAIAKHSALKVPWASAPLARGAMRAGGTDPRLAPLAADQALEHAQWQEFDGLRAAALKDLAREPVAMTPFMATRFTEDSALLHRCAAGHMALAGQAARPFTGEYRRGDPKRITVGYMSSEFYNHATSQLFAELFELHDRRRFRVIGFGVVSDDGSAIGNRIRRAFDQFFDLERDWTDDAVGKITGAGVDILVDLGSGHTSDIRRDILLSRTAPLQVGYLGFPGTSGSTATHYIMVDRTVLPPENAVHFSEAPIYLPDTYQVNDRKRPVAPSSAARRGLGLPETGVVFCCFNETRKILPEVFRIWMRILGRVPDSVLFLLGATADARENLRKEAMAAGIAPDRIVFGGRLTPAEHLARYRHCDLFLDTWPYGAHTTASDALWVGCPVVTVLRPAFPGRVAASLLRAAGFEELVTRSPAEYEELAVKIGLDAAYRGALRARLTETRPSCALFDTPRFVRGVEWAYEEIWARHMRGEAPAPLTVPPRP